MVEPLVYTQIVGSSSLSLSTFRDVAQLVARLVWDQDVAGSNPVIPTYTSVQRQKFFIFKRLYIKSYKDSNRSERAGRRTGCMEAAGSERRRLSEVHRKCTPGK